MKKPSLSDALARKEAPAVPPADTPAPAARTKDKDTIATTIRLDADRLERLKIVAARRRCRVNELLLEGVDHVLALHEAKTQ